MSSTYVPNKCSVFASGAFTLPQKRRKEVNQFICTGIVSLFRKMAGMLFLCPQVSPELGGMCFFSAGVTEPCLCTQSKGTVSK